VKKFKKGENKQGEPVGLLPKKLFLHVLVFSAIVTGI